MTRFDLRPLLAPRSIAIVGASESPDSWAPEIYRSLLHLGFEGEIFPVNPKYDEVWGRPCHSSVLELPRGVDLAVLVVPARVVVRSIEGCGTAGVRSVMVVSSGFAEAGPRDRALQQELRRAALANRVPLLGPNVEGFVNYVDRVAPLRHHAAAGSGRGPHHRDLAERHRRLDDEPARVGPRGGSAPDPRCRQRGRARDR